MTFNELKKRYPKFRFKASTEDWSIIRKTKGKCKVIDYTIDCDDMEIYLDIIF